MVHIGFILCFEFYIMALNDWYLSVLDWANLKVNDCWSPHLMYNLQKSWTSMDLFHIWGQFCH